MGTSDGLFAKREINGDHPHAYGDKLTSMASALKFLGSSPRVWGQVNMDTSTIVQIRIIPTRMGTSMFSFSQRYAQ